MTRDEMMARMSATEFYGWMMLEQIEPFGDRRLDLLCGMLSAMMANLHGRGEDDPPFTPDQFMPDFDGREQAEPTPEEQAQLLDSIFDIP